MITSTGTCLRCGLAFSRERKRGPAPKYCSTKCKDLYNHPYTKKTRVLKVCLYCKGTWSPGHEGAKFCSARCGAKWRYRNDPESRAKTLARARVHSAAWHKKKAAEDPEWAKLRRNGFLRARLGEDWDWFSKLLEVKLEYWGGRCWVCGEHPEKIQWDHVKPKSKGGADLICNLRPSCPDCNNAKRAKWPHPTSAFYAA